MKYIEELTDKIVQILQEDWNGNLSGLRRLNPTPTAIAAEKIAAVLRAEKPRLPVGVSVLLTADDATGRSVLLGRRKNNTAAGMLSTPGGRVEYSESVLQTACREFNEETSARLCAPLSVIAAHQHQRYGDNYVMFYVHAVAYGGNIANVEPQKCEGWTWHSVADLIEVCSTGGEECTEPVAVLRKLL